MTTPFVSILSTAAPEASKFGRSPAAKALAQSYLQPTGNAACSPAPAAFGCTTFSWCTTFSRTPWCTPSKGLILCERWRRRWMPPEPMSSNVRDNVAELIVVDLATYDIVRTTELGASRFPGTVVVGPDDLIVYVLAVAREGQGPGLGCHRQGGSRTEFCAVPRFPEHFLHRPTPRLELAALRFPPAMRPAALAMPKMRGKRL